jgi:hypothetical protein
MLRLAYSAPDTRCQRLSLVAPAPSLSISFTANARKRATPQTQVSHSPYDLLYYIYYLFKILPSSSAKSDGVHEQLALRYTAYSSFMSSLTRISSRARELALRYTAYSPLKDGHTVDHPFACSNLCVGISFFCYYCAVLWRVVEWWRCGERQVGGDSRTVARSCCTFVRLNFHCCLLATAVAC